MLLAGSPQRPAGTDDLDEAQLAQLVHRDCLVGVTDPQPELV